MSPKKNLALLMFASLLVLSSCGTQDEKKSEDEAVAQEEMQSGEEVRQLAQSYINAINERDLQKIADMWSEESVYRNPITGELIQGREGIKNQFSDMFSHFPGGSVQLDLDTVSFPFEEKAVGKGVITLKRQGDPDLKRDFEITFVKNKGKWLIYHVSLIDLSMLKGTNGEGSNGSEKSAK